MSDSASDPKQIFLEAIDRESPEELRRYLDKACGDNAQVRSRVEALLQAHGKVGNFLGGPPPDTVTTDQSVTETPGAVIGPYKLLQPIGEGGMGVVYMAEQREPVERRVALKVIRPGMDSRQVITRFEAEEQALAMMDHPNIARVFDAGTTTTGRPYFVMELVKGVPITEYCDEHHLTPRQRLELFVPLCHAVQHAHQKGIIHRDIKPSNVLVAEYDGRPVPKIIDFGVAKAIQQRLTERTVFTQLGQVVGTIEYMSPEQAKLNQMDVDTRSDIYSLGVLLYELLTSETPFDRQRLHTAAFDDLLRIIREEEPPKPSVRLSSSESLPSIAANRQIEPKKLSTLLRGELDWIVMKAMEKDRGRRYETANALAADVTHYLANEPVVACPPSAVYRFSKFARRNRTLLTAVVFMLAIVLGGAGISISQAIRATNAERIAAERLAAEQQARLEERRHLWRSYVNEAAALRRTRRVGYRSESLDRLRKAAGMLGNLHLPETNTRELRNEWIACSALPVDLRLEKEMPTEGEVLGVDSGLRYSLCRDVHRAVHLYRLADGNKVDWLTAHSDFAFGQWGNVFSPDGRFLAGRSRADFYRIWDLDERRVVKDVPVASGSYAVSFTPDSQAVALGQEDKRIHFWDLATGAHLNELSEGPAVARRLWLSPVGEQLAVVFDGLREVHVRDAQTGDTTVLEHPAAARLAAWSDDGRLLAVSCDDFNIHVWDAQTWKPRATLRGHQWGGIDTVFWPRSHRLYSGAWDSTRRLWDAWTGLELLRMASGDRLVGFNADECQLVCQASCKARFWKVLSSQTFHMLPVSAPANAQRYSIGFHPDGRLLACTSDRGVHLWNQEEISETAFLPLTKCTSVIFRPGGSQLITSSAAGLQRWPLKMDAAGQCISPGPGEPLVDTITGTTEGACLTPDGRFLAVLGVPKVIWCDLRTGQTKMSAFTPDLTCSASISPDGRWIGTGDGEAFVLWDTQSNQEAVTELWPEPTRFWAAFDATSQWLYVSTRETGRIFQVGTWQVVHQIDGSKDVTGEEPAFGPAAFAPDSRMLAFGNAIGAVHLLDTATWQELATLQPFEPRTIVSVAFAPDGNLLAAATLNDGVQLWDLGRIRQELRNLGVDW
jgi:serine/threonine protein kinase/WD40 repeat protein